MDTIAERPRSSGLVERLRGLGRLLLRIPRGWAWALPALWMALIWFVSSLEQLPAIGFAGGVSFFGNLAHSFEFGILALLLIPLAPRSEGWARLCRKQITWIAVVAIGYAWIDEAHQETVVGRDASLLDLITDAVGVYCTLHVARYLGGSGATASGLRRRLAIGVLLCCASAGIATLWSAYRGDGPWI